ncbi:laccase-1 protein [Spatholobus suberectus]|nr:laccase-1 protein [Spatholobus suberectus]
MANPPQVRPWFRLASIRSTAAPAPAPAPAQEPRTTLGLPAFRTASAPSSPQTHPTQPPQEPSSQPNKFSSSSLPTSPVHKGTVTTSSPARSPPEKSARVPVPVPSPTHSPKTIKQTGRSPMQSPNNNKPTAPLPSPLTLPPPQLKTEPKIPEQAEPKTVLVQKTIDRPKPRHNGANESHKNHGNAKHVPGKESESKEKGVHRKLSDSEDSGMRVITIAGENRGAYMELTQSPKKQEPKHLHKKGNTNINVDGVESESSSAEEGKVSKKDKNHKGRTASSFPMAAYMNSNVQCVNNSLLYHTSCSHHDPGVRLSLSKKPFGEGFHLKEHVEGHHT